MSACVLAGLAAGVVANASASASGHAARHRLRRAGLRLRVLRLVRHTVEGSFVVATKHGFVTVTVARGSLVSQSGGELTLNEGTRTKTYRSGVSLTLPATTVVANNGRRSTLGSLTPGERVIVLEGPHRAMVLAHTPAAG